MLLLDKGYYDYDFKMVDKQRPVVDWEETIKSDEEVQSILSIFGMGQKQPESLEEIQNHIIKEIKEDK